MVKSLLAFAMTVLSVLTPGEAYAINGQEVSPDLYRKAKPSLATISSTDNSLNCSGVLITRRHILTAGHCVIGSKDILRVSFFNESGSELVMKAKKISINPVWEKELPKYQETLEQKNMYNRLFRRLIRDETRLNRDYLENNIEQACKVMKIKQIDVRDGEAIREAEDQIERLRNLIYHANLRVKDQREIRMVCMNWIDEAGEYFRRLAKLNQDGVKLLKEPEIPGDLAIIELSGKVPGEFRAMKLEFAKFTPPLGQLLIAGSGLTANGEIGHPRMAMIDLIVESRDRLLSGVSAVACPGDSGGAVADVDSGEPRLIAINSEVMQDDVSKDCQLKESVAVAIKVADYADWIRSVIKIRDKSK